MSSFTYHIPAYSGFHLHLTWSFFCYKVLLSQHKIHMPKKCFFFLVLSSLALAYQRSAKYKLSTSKTIHFTLVWIPSFQFSHIYIYIFFTKIDYWVLDIFRRAKQSPSKGLAHVSGQLAEAEVLILLIAFRNLSHFLYLRCQVHIQHCRNTSLCTLYK